MQFFRINLSNLIGASLLGIYGLLFLLDICPYWLSDQWITDDAMQQVYQFHEVTYPGRFKGDIVTQSMSLYLAPLHYWLGYLITVLTRNPLITANLMMMIQVFASAFFIFLAIFHSSGFFAACLGALWFLHSGILIQRLSGGLPRGWISPLIALYLYLAIKRKHIAIIITLFIACLLNSLAAFILITSYGLFLLWDLFKNRKPKPLLIFLACCPVYLATTFYVVKRPDTIGEMVSYEEALKMPALTKSGRFKIAPLPPVTAEFESQAVQVFTVYYHKTFNRLRRYAVPIVLSLTGLLAAAALIRKKSIVDSSLPTFIAATIFCYLAARIMAFDLYVPNRYLRFPFSIFFICFFCAGIWNLFKNKKAAYISYAVLAIYVYLGTGSGLQREAGYNYKEGQDGEVYEWIKNNTPPDAVIAGYPNVVDPVPLFSIRRVYISNETAHPFYDRYYALVKERLNRTLRAHYARSFQEFLEAFKDEKVDYFIFERRRFKPDELKQATYFAPFDKLIEELTQADATDYLYFKIRDGEESYVKFIDSRVILVDLNQMRLSKTALGSSN